MQKLLQVRLTISKKVNVTTDEQCSSSTVYTGWCIKTSPIQTIMAQETKHVFSMTLGYFIPTCTFTNCVHVTRDVSTEKVLNRNVENRKNYVICTVCWYICLMFS